MNHINPSTIRTYVEKLEQKGYDSASITRKMSSVFKYLQWAYDKDKLSFKQFQQVKDEIDKIQASFEEQVHETVTGRALNQSTTSAAQVHLIKENKITSWVKEIVRSIPFLGSLINDTPSGDDIDQNDFQPQYIVAFAFVLIIMAILGAGIYERFFAKTSGILAYPSTPVVAGRILSFQGRLTDSLGNPISTATNMRFRLYTASSGGTTLYDSGTCSITPDQDGIHNVLIGSDCGAEITSSVFTENATVYLGVTVGSDAEMIPRQQIANVAYAMNAETLQGLPLGTGASNVAYINQGGDLLIAASSPQVGSTFASQTFLLSSANALTIQSAGTGDITLTATESGTIKFLTGGSQAGYFDNDGNLIMSNGNQFQLGNLAADPTAIGNGALYYNTVDNKVYYYNGSNWAEMGSGAGGGLWQVNSATLSPGISTYDVLTGSTATASALVRLPGTTNNDAFFNLGTGNVGIGTTGPDRKLDVLDASSPQLRLTQADNSIYSDFQTDGSGNLTVTTTGSTVTFSGDTVNASDFACTDCLDFAELDDTLDLDNTLIVNQGTNTWTQNFTGTTTTGYTYNADSLTTGIGALYSIDALTTGTGLSLSSTSTALGASVLGGSLANFDWTPGSSTTAATDLFRLNIGANGSVTNLLNITDAGTSVFRVAENQVEASVPTSFTAAGDTSFAYDLLLSNQTASYIKSNAPLTIETGESWESNDLTLKTYNSGNILLDAGNSTSATGTISFYDSNIKGATTTTAIPFADASSTINTFRTNYTNENIVGALNEVYSVATGGGAGSVWTDSGTNIYLTSTTDELVIGGTTALSSSKVSIDGDADQIQLTVQGNGTQTSNLAVFENSGGTDLFVVDGSGNLTVAGTTGLTFSSTGGVVLAGGTISDGTDGVDINDDLEVSGNTTLTGTLAVNGDNITSDGTLTIDATTDIVLDADDADVILKNGGTTFATFTDSTTDLTLDIVGGDLILANADVLNIGGNGDDIAFSAIGDDTANAGNVNGDNDLYIEDDLEVDGTIFGNISGTITPGFTTGSVVFAGASGELAQDNTNFFWDDTNNKLGIGIAAPVGKLDVSGKVTGKALAIFDETGDQDILTASAGGTTRFRVANDGALYGGYLADISNATYGIDPAGTSNFGGYSLKVTGGALLAADSGLVGIGNPTPVGKLDVNGAVTGKALAIFNETGDQDILTASAGGVTQATLSRTGNLTLVGNLAVNGDNITSDGTLTIDATTDIVLDADDADVILKNGGTTFATFTDSSTDLTLDIVGGDLILANADVLNIGGNGDDVAFSAIGDDTANAGNVNSDNDLYIEDDLEVDGTIFGNISGTITPGFTAGSVVFTGASGELAQDNTNFFWDDTNNKLGIGIAAPVGKLDVSGKVTGKALAIFDETGDQNILVASASGVTQATLGRTGNLAIEGAISDLGGTTLAVNDNLDVSGTLLAGTTDAFQVDASGNITTSGTTGLTFSSTGGLVLNGGTFVDNTDGVDIADDLEISGGTTLGDASGDTVTANAAAWTFANDTTIALTGGLNGLNIDSNTLSIDANSNRVGIGTAAPDASLQVGTTLAGLEKSNYFTVHQAITSTASTEYAGVGLLSLQQASNTSQVYMGLRGYVETDSAQTYSGSIIGVDGTVSPGGTSTITGSAIGIRGTAIDGMRPVTNLIAVDALPVLIGGSTTNVYGVKVEDFAGSATTGYGLYLGNAGGTTDYGIYQSSSTDDNYFAGSIGINDTTPDAKLDIDSSSTTGSDFLITNTGVGTSGTIAGITANSVTSGDIVTLSATGMTTGSMLIATGPSSTGVTDHFFKLTSDIGSASSLLNLNPDFSGSAVTGYGIYNTATDATANANTDYGYYGSLALTGNAAKNGYGIFSTVSSSSTTADTLAALDTSTSTTGIITTGTRNVYGLRSQPASTAASTGGTTNVYGGYFKSGGVVGAGGTINSYGVYIANGTMDGTGTSANYGLYVETPSGADNNYAAIFAGGNVGIGDTTPDAFLDVTGSTTQLRLSYETGDTNYTNFTVGSSGDLTIAPSGNDTNVTGNVSASGTYANKGQAAQASIGYYSYFLNYASAAQGVWNQLETNTGREIVGVENYLRNTDGNSYGIFNDILHSQAGGAPFGVYNQVLRAGAGEAWGVYSGTYGNADSATQTTYSFDASIATFSGGSDIAYGLRVLDGGYNSTGGTQYGTYIDLDDPDVTNYSLYVENGSGISYFGSNIGVADTTPDALIDSTGTTTQLRLSYETGDTNYANFTVGSSGDLTIAPSGGDLSLTGNFLPTTNDTYALGSDSNRWSDIFLGPETLHIGTSTTDEGTIGYTTGTNVFGFTNNYGDTDFSSSSDGFNFTLGGGAGDDFIVDSTTLVVESDNNRVGIGTAAPDGQLHVSGASIGKALAIFNETGDQNILVASASGITQATISRTGDLTLVGNLAVNGDTITADGALTLNSVSYIRVGDTATPGSANGDDDLYVEGDIEADGVLYLDGTLDTTFTAGSVAFAGTNGVLSQDNDNFFWDDSGNKLILGGTSGDSPLHVFSGSAGTVSAYSSIATFESSSSSYISILSPDASERGILFGEPSSNAAGGLIYNSATTADGWQFRVGGNQTAAVLTSAYKFGVNTTGPDAMVDALTTSGEQLRLTYTDGSVYTSFTTDSAGDLLIDPTGADITVDADILPNTDDTYDLGSDTKRWQDLYLGPQTLHIGTSTTDEGTIGYVTGTNVLTFTNNYGDTNFGTTSDGFNFTLGGGAGDDFIVDDTTLVVESDNDRVGIGTAAPGAKLDIQGSDASTVQLIIQSANGQTANLFEMYDVDIAGTIGAIDTQARLAMGDGDTSTVGYGFKADTNTGMYRYSTDILAFATNGVGRLAIDASGNFTRNGNEGVNALPDQGSIAPNGSFEVDINASYPPDDWSDKTGSNGYTTSDSSHADKAITLDTQKDQIWSTCFPVGSDDSGSSKYSVSLQAKASALSTPLKAGIYTYTTLARCQSDTGANTLTGCNASVSTAWTNCGGSAAITSGDHWARGWIINEDVQNDDVYVDGYRVTPVSTTVGLDLAETYPVAISDAIQVGEIVAFGTQIKQNDTDVKNVVRSAQPYDGKAFGVVATQPGLTLDDGKSYSKVTVALKGRVPVLVTTENGPINIGDPITASSIPGVGMKATRSGRIIGYAMTEWTDPDPKKIDQVTLFINPETYIDTSILTDLQNKIESLPQSASHLSTSVENTIFGIIEATALTTEKLVSSTIKAGTATIDTLIVDKIVGKNIESESLSALSITSKNIKTDSLNTENLIGRDASLSGKLVAQEVDAENIREFRKRIETAVEKTELNEDSTKQNEESVSALNEKVSTIEKYIDDIKNEKLADSKIYQSVFDDIPVDPGAQESEDGRLINPVSFDNLLVTGQGAFVSATVTDNFTVGSVFIKDNEIIALNNDLRLNALEKVSILDGAVIVDRSGKMTVKGEIIAQGGVRTNSIKAINDGDTVKVENSDVSIVNSENEEVASINASGSAKFADLSLDKYTDATSSASVIAAVQNYKETGIFAPAIRTNAAATGNGVLPSHNNDIILFNNKITPDSLIYITATSSTNNQQLYVAEKSTCPAPETISSSTPPCQPFFKVALDRSLPTDTTFNWWIVN